MAIVVLRESVRKFRFTSSSQNKKVRHRMRRAAAQITTATTAGMLMWWYVGSDRVLTKSRPDCVLVYPRDPYKVRFKERPRCDVNAHTHANTFRLGSSNARVLKEKVWSKRGVGGNTCGRSG